MKSKQSCAGYISIILFCCFILLSLILLLSIHCSFVIPSFFPSFPSSFVLLFLFFCPSSFVVLFLFFCLYHSAFHHSCHSIFLLLILLSIILLLFFYHSSFFHPSILIFLQKKNDEKKNSGKTKEE